MGKHFPVPLIKMRYRYVFKKPIDLKNPKDLNEKILWAKLFSDTSRWSELADKYKVRDYVEGLGLGKYLVKLYAVWYDAKEVNFDALPETFIIKANNGDGKGRHYDRHQIIRHFMFLFFVLGIYSLDNSPFLCFFLRFGDLYKTFFVHLQPQLIPKAMDKNFIGRTSTVSISARIQN